MARSILAAFATANQPDELQLVIRDSRLAHPPIHRMDAQPAANGHDATPPYLLANPAWDCIHMARSLVGPEEFSLRAQRG